VLTQHDESLDKCEQYMLDLRWSTAETGHILRNKITSFFDRTYGYLPQADTPFDIVFKQPFPWRTETGATRPLAAHQPIHVLSGGRPRWANQLCRLAGKHAFQHHRDRITFGDVRASLREYGKFRLADLYKEHLHQCPKLELLVESFAGGIAMYYTPELMQMIKRKIIDRFGMPEIDGLGARDGAMAVAQFLYRIGFLSAYDDDFESSSQFIHFEDRPHLLSSKQNPDDGLVWAIHPSYRSVLRIDPPYASQPKRLNVQVNKFGMR
jgi:hypothetical protein